ncbi:YdeI/OmpD-associated family protein [Roseateles sp. DC23W]|uniref:YdeI/OmpD-associated family protein n=1 Tax=Pelomonas dachongensis TaxID=3299029 RepID=A0ABW7EGY0_9BURK
MPTNSRRRLICRAASLKPSSAIGGPGSSSRPHPPGYRKLVLHWVTSAKKDETRASRFARLVLACTDGVRLR